MKLLERYKQGLITRQEYLEQGNFPCDINYDYHKSQLKQYAHNYYFGRVAWYAKRIKVDENWMLENIVDCADDCKNFTNKERITHPDFCLTFRSLLDAINGLMPPVPI